MKARRDSTAEPVELVIAPLWRRAAAGVINTSVVLGVVGVVIGAGVALAGLVESAAPKLPEVVRRQSKRLGRVISDWAKGPAPNVSPSAMFLMSGAMWSLTIDRRNSRWLGARLMRIRRADQRTGGPVTVRSVIVREVTAQMQSVLTRPIYDRMGKPNRADNDAKREALKPYLEHLAREHADDQGAYVKAAAELYRRHHVMSFSSCLRPILALILFNGIPIWLSPRRQSIPNRLAGIVVVVGRPATKRSNRRRP